MSLAQPLAAYIDHTNLKPEATSLDIERLCEEASQYGFHSVCVHPCWVLLAVKKLENTSVNVCTVIGFPLGGNLSSTKVLETRKCLDLGANEFDMVINVGAVKELRWDFIQDEVSQVVEAASGNCVKVILETCLLSEDEIIKACRICERAGANFVKTSTGFNQRGATVEDVTVMRDSVSASMGVKASGGIKDKKSAEAMIAAGATRIGTSSGVSILSEN